MQWSRGAQALVRLGLVVLLGAAVAAVWEVLALQAPTSPYHFGVLPGPVGALRDSASITALCLFAAAWLWPWASQGRELRAWLVLVHVGVIVSLGALTYGATTGMYGVQIDDLRVDSRWLFRIRAMGQLVLAGCLVDYARRVLFTRAPG